MNTLQTILKINAAYLPDPDATIEVLGTFVNYRGEKVAAPFEIQDDGTGPVIWPGLWFIPYGGAWSNPVHLKISEQ